jgi:hypothetical protein
MQSKARQFGAPHYKDTSTSYALSTGDEKSGTARGKNISTVEGLFSQQLHKNPKLYYDYIKNMFIVPVSLQQTQQVCLLISWHSFSYRLGNTYPVQTMHVNYCDNTNSRLDPISSHVNTIHSFSPL